MTGVQTCALPICCTEKAARGTQTLIDVLNCGQPRTYENDDIISGAKGFSANINGELDTLNYAVADYPWPNTSITESSKVDLTWLADDSKGKLVIDFKADVLAKVDPNAVDQSKRAKLDVIIE